MKNLTHRLGVEFSIRPGRREGKGEDGVGKGCGGLWYSGSRGMKSIISGKAFIKSRNVRRSGNESR